ncbi:MAG: tetratricopeptide repeat protein [Desulfosarcina sp.]|nr:tetratricopeptide repeat protein [Desulfosarcina sp.]MBC2741672.1 tetratricopeptide repeat protein [Desulfosarcina sp.]MBC2764586.1 tetratricopeptide repeat protein [Desulfosarcina sp.]
MKVNKIIVGLLMAAVIAVGVSPGIGFGALQSGSQVPVFTLKDINGKAYPLSGIKNMAMTILYFFDADSRPSIEGLLSLDRLAKQYRDADLTVWAITRSPKQKVSAFQDSTQTVFPVLLDTASVSDMYDAQRVLPTVCIVGPELKMLDFFQGGGKTTQVMLVRLAERNLQRKKPEIARAITETVERSDPGNAQARTVKGYAAIQEGKLDEAEQTFYDLSKEKGSSGILGKEGLARVYEKKGQTEKSLQLAKEVAAQAGDRPLVHVIKGDQLYRQNKQKAAEAAYREGTQKRGGAPFQRAVAYNQLGRLYAQRGDYAKSRELYDQAVSIDPYYIEATSNKGLTYEQEGRWDKALEVYRRAEAIDKNDPFVRALAENAMRMLMIKKDEMKQKELAVAIKKVVERYRQKRFDPISVDDPWTSRPTRVAFFDISESGGLSQRAGFAGLLKDHLARQMGASGRVLVMDNLIVDGVIDELGLDRNALADDEIRSRLSRAMQASLMIKGSVYQMPSGPLCNLKIVTSEDARPIELIDYQFTAGIHLQKDLNQINRQLLTRIMEKYPLQAFVVEVSGNQVLLNLGSLQGVVEGTVFDVIEEKPPVTYKGKQFIPEPGLVAKVHVVRTDDDFSYGHIKEQRRPIKQDDKLRENLNALVPNNQSTRIW